MKKNSLNEIEAEKAAIQTLLGHVYTRIHKINPEDNFIKDIDSFLNIEIKKSDKNKNFYFTSETIILIFSGCSGFFSVLGVSGICGDIFREAFGVIASVFSVVITILIGMRGLRKWQETWLRHRGYLNMCYEECYLYAHSIGKYKGYRPIGYEIEYCVEEHIKQHEAEVLDIFKESIIHILTQNNKDFMKNMKTQAKEQNSQYKQE